MKIISGGQTGVDRAALDAALELGLEIGGYIPKGRKAEDGRIPDRYQELMETYESDYPPRTKLNIQTSNATLILMQSPAELDRGTQYTHEFCNKVGKEVLMHFLGKFEKYNNHTTNFLRLDFFPKINVLNIAGPRESKSPGIYEAAKKFLLEVLPNGR